MLRRPMHADRTYTPLLLIRHAQSDWNADGRWQGHADPPLSAAGRAQAVALAETLTALAPADRPSRIECSDLRRARETAEELGRRLGLPVFVDESYRELDVGDWSGLRRIEIDARDAELLARFDREDLSARPPGGETRGELRARARAAVVALGAAHPGERVALVTHLGFIRALVPGAVPGNAELLRSSIRALLAMRPASAVVSEADARAY